MVKKDHFSTKGIYEIFSIYFCLRRFGDVNLAIINDFKKVEKYYNSNKEIHDAKTIERYINRKGDVDFDETIW